MHPKIYNEAQLKIQSEMRAFVKDDIPRQLLLDIDEDKIRYPREFIEKAAKKNLLGLRFPKEYGGRGLGWKEEVVALEEVGVLGTALPCLYSLVSIVGEAINKFGTKQQKEKYLLPTLQGKLTTAEGLTEPRGGSDFYGATTTAKKEGNYYILNGQKRFVVGAEGADYFFIYAKTGVDANGRQSMSAFLVDRTMGVEVEHVYGLMGTRGGGTGRIVFRNLKIPKENLVGEENNAFEIFNQMMVPERMTSAAGALGMARTALEIAAKYSNKRKAFGQKIRSFEAVSFMIADSLTKLDAARALVHATAQAIDNNVDASLQRRLVSESKKYATDTAWEVINNAMQVMGGIGYTNVFPIERLLRDARLIMIWTGTNEIMNLVIQHEYFKQLLAPNGEFVEKDIRNLENDATDADKIDEKVYE
ncbi:MAG: acyl-CoA dehydrogenase family protein [Stygiobacter sp.]|uniref:Acyl-CoA/acyl-ACP dehydrogenase n=1 Tax=Stygiobacter electus TaxID=3032292 RepID=A0AAE3TE42_9BACT|nr:acyl-CoA dehydrogenase family protein [Stygiobacter electus]MDF1613141.1 acyl-CoA/acyl-ACP dehydrogenase [Stygiobacter electus]